MRAEPDICRKHILVRITGIKLVSVVLNKTCKLIVEMALVKELLGHSINKFSVF